MTIAKFHPNHELSKPSEKRNKLAIVKDSATIRRMFTKKVGGIKTSKITTPKSPNPRIDLSFLNRDSPLKINENKKRLMKIGTIMNRARKHESTNQDSSEVSDNFSDSVSNVDEDEKNDFQLPERPPETFMDLFHREKKKKEKKMLAVTPRIMHKSK